MKILFIPPVIGNYHKVRAIELSIVLAKAGHDCIYINPIRYKGWEKSKREI